MKSAGFLPILAILALTGCSVTTSSSNAARPPVQGAPQDVFQNNNPAAQGGVGGIARTLDRQTIQNDLKQIVLFYRTYEAELGRVNTLEAFKNYLKRDAGKIYQALQDKVYVVVLNVRPAGNVVVAYERSPDANDQHLVAMGDGTVTQLTTQQLQTRLKEQGN